MEKGAYIHPYVRLVFLVSGLYGAIFAERMEYLIFYYILMLVPILIWGRLVKQHLYFLLIGTLPIFLSFILLYIMILNGSKGGWQFIFERIIRISIAAFVFQLTLSIPAKSIVNTFKAWGFKNELLMIALGIFIVSEDMIHTADKIITARFARGLIGKRNFINKVRQFPSMLMPLMISMVRSSVERSESWHQKKILDLIHLAKMPMSRYSIFWNVFLLTGSIVLLITTVSHQFM